MGTDSFVLFGIKVIIHVSCDTVCKEIFLHINHTVKSAFDTIRISLKCSIVNFTKPSN